MKKIILALSILITSVFSQISYGGSPKYKIGDDLRNVPVVIMESVDFDEYHNDMISNPDIKYFVYGYEFDVDINFFELAKKIDTGSGYLNYLILESQDAYAISLLYDSFYLAPGVEMFISSYKGDMYIGSFNELNNHDSNTFTTQLVKGDKIVLEVFEPYASEGLSDIHIYQLIHDFTNLLSYNNLGQEERVDCNTNVECSDGDNYRDIIDSVMLLSMGGGYCSASLVNNTAQDLTPYVLTAEHCISGSTSNYTFYFNYQTPTCIGGNASQSQSVTGSTLRVSESIDGGADFALLEMFNQPPESYNPFFAGWSNSSSSPQGALGIHHPNAGVKKITLDGTTPFGNGDYWEFQYNDGRVVPGSSGSPLFDQNKRQVGICSYIYTNYCDPSPDCYCAQQYQHGYGRIDQAWYALASYLDPLNTGVTGIDGTGLSGVSISHTTLDDQPYSGSSFTFNASIQSYSADVISAELNYDIGAGWNSTSMSSGVGNNYSATVNGVQDGTIISYYFIAEDSEGNYAIFPPSAPDSPLSFVLGDLPVLVSDNFENSSGWTVGDPTDNATTGIWVLADPNPAFADGAQSQPGDDHSSSGNLCFVTGNGSNQNEAGENDVDGGKTTLLSPIFDLSNVTEARLSYWYWYSNNLGASPSADYWQVYISNDGGSQWTNFVNTSSSTSAWTKAEFFLSGIINMTSQMQFKFVAEDSGEGSLVEAAIDDFLIELISAPEPSLLGDLNGDETINILDIVILVNMVLDVEEPDYYNGDVNGDGVLNILDIIQVINIALEG